MSKAGTILVVDDDASIRDLIAKALVDQGHTLSGRSAPERLR